MANVLAWNAIKCQIHGAINLDESIEQSLKGNNVFLLDCDESLGGCWSNIKFNKSFCKLCSFLDKQTRKNRIPDDITILKIKDYIHNDIKNSSFQLCYNNIDDLKNLEYKEINIGFGAYSTYIDFTRNPNPGLDTEHRKFLNKLLIQSIQLIDAILDIIEKYSIDYIVLCNGRFSSLRPVLEIAKKLNIPYLTTEVCGKHPDIRYKDYNFNSIPHDAENYKFKCDSLWDHSKLTESEKVSVGKSFFENRRKKKNTGDKIYTASQTEGLLPSDINDHKENIVIFNSSEDEFSAIGGKFESIKLFNSQIEGIKAIVDHYSGDSSKHFYLRIHPNLKKITYSYHKDLYKLNYPNLTIIGADSNIDTYSIMEKADKVIVYGSTAGIEASYMKKAVISLRYCMYYSFNIAYFPKSITELWHLIDTKNLPSLFNPSIYRYGFYIMSDEHERFKHFNVDFLNYKIANNNVKIMKFQKILGSNKLFAYIYFIGKKICSILFKDNFKEIPQ